MRKSLLVTALLATFASPNITMADEVAPAASAASTPDWTFPMTVGAVSDYIFRGQSQSWGKLSFQGSIEADHSSGLYGGLSIESVSDRWLPGANLETDLYGGFRGKIPSTDLTFDVGGIYYAYPNADWNKSVFAGTKSNSLNTFEVYGGLTYKWLTFKAGTTLTEYFGWNTNNSGVGSGFAGDPKAGVKGNTRYSSFYEADAAYEVIPSWTVSGQIGHQIVAKSTGLDITYYKAGVTKAFASGWSVGGFVSATDEPNAYKNFASLSNSGGSSDIAKTQVFLTVFKSF